MAPSLLRRMRSLFNGSDDDESDDESEPPDRPQTALRTCPDCEKTYIVEEMDTCPDCGTPVEETPSEQDLGFW